MKITYESGDYAVVEDNIEAGEAAAHDVKLKYKKANSKIWVVELIDSDSDSSEVEVHEQWLRP
jgi:hypothetical protein